MLVPFRYMEIVPAFIYTAKNDVRRKHYDHIQVKVYCDGKAG